LDWRHSAFEPATRFAYRSGRGVWTHSALPLRFHLQSDAILLPSADSTEHSILPSLGACTPSQAESSVSLSHQLPTRLVPLPSPRSFDRLILRPYFNTTATRPPTVASVIKHVGEYNRTSPSVSRRQQQSLPAPARGSHMFPRPQPVLRALPARRSGPDPLQQSRLRSESSTVGGQ